MRTFYVLVVCTFAATVIHSCESKEHQARVADYHTVHPEYHSDWKTVEEDKVKESSVSSEEELPGSNVNPEEIVQKAKSATERAKGYPKSLKQWELKLKRKMAAQKAGEKNTQQAELVSSKAHSQDREEVRVHAASPEPRMTFDDWENKFNEARSAYLKNHQQQVKIAAASPVKVYSESMKDLEQEIDKEVEVASPRYKPMPYRHHRPSVEEEMKQEVKQQAKMASSRPNSNPYYHPSTVETGKGVKEAVLQREREKIMQRYNAAIQNAMMLNRDDVKERIREEATKRGYPWGK